MCFQIRFCRFVDRSKKNIAKGESLHFSGLPKLTRIIRIAFHVSLYPLIWFDQGKKKID